MFYFGHYIRLAVSVHDLATIGCCKYIFRKELR